MKYRYLLATAMVAILASACSKSGVEVKKEDLFATIDGTQISSQEVDELVKELSNGSVTADKLTAEQRQQVTDSLLGIHAAAEQASKDGLDKQADTVAQLSYLRANALSNALIKQYLEKNPVTDAEVQSEYDTQVAALPREYHASHILVKTKDEADKLLAQLKSGADFAALAKKNSLDPGSAKQGGDLGWFAPSTMVAEFGAAITQLKNDEITPAPVQTQYGFHIIKLHESRNPTPPALADVKSQVESIVKNKKVNEYLDSLRKAAKVEMGPAATASAASSSASSVEAAK